MQNYKLCKILALLLVFVAGLTVELKAQTPEPPTPDFFIEAEVDNYSPYLGQQITYTLKRYQAIDFPNPPYYEDRPFTGFWETPLIQRPTYTTTLNDREYRVHPTHMALFPTVAGSSTIIPARLIIPGDGPEADIIIESQAITIQVQELPPNPPTHFRGAVGQFTISASFDTSEGVAGDIFKLIVEIEGAGNIETLVEPSAPNIDQWIINMFGSSSVTDVPLAKDMVKGSRQFIWSIIPTEPGEQFFPAIRFSFFNPETAAYESIRTDPLRITIESYEPEDQSTFLSPLNIPQQEITRLAVDIRHIKSVPNELNRIGVSSLMILFYMSGVILPVVVMAGVWRWYQVRMQYRDKSPQMRRRLASQYARQRLAKVTETQAAAEALIYQIVSDYLAAKLNHPITGLTSTQLADLLEHTKLPSALIERVKNLLVEADAHRFAPTARSTEAINTLVHNARQLIDDLEQHFNQ